MDASLKKTILDLIDEHRIMTLATLRADGWPQATTVGYVSDGLRLYFMCGRDSQKAANLARDNRVSLTIDHDTKDPMGIRGLSMAARAEPVAAQDRIRATVMQKMPGKYPEYGEMMKDIDLGDVAVFELLPEVISVLDYSKGFGHTDQVVLTQADLGG